MAEKAPTAAAKKKIYKKPTPVKSVDSAKSRPTLAPAVADSWSVGQTTPADIN